MEGAGGDNFQDWEGLQNSDSDSALVNSPDRAAAAAAAVEEEIDDGVYSEGVIRPDCFSVDNQNRYAKTNVVVVVSEEEAGSIESDNPSWFDPGSETLYPVKNSGEFWSDSGNDRSDERKLGKSQAGSLRLGGFDGGVQKGTDIMSSSVVVVVKEDHVKKQLQKEEEESEIVESNESRRPVELPKCAVAATKYSRRFPGSEGLLRRPYVHSMPAIAAVCVCVFLFVRGVPQIGQLPPFKWESSGGSNSKP